MRRSISVAAALLILGGCSCGGTGKGDGGSDGGRSNGDGGNGADAGSGDAGSGDGGNPNFLPFDQYCATVFQGAQNIFAPALKCGSPVTQADVPHLQFQLGGTYAQAWANSGCTDAGILGQLTAVLATGIANGQLQYDGTRAAACVALGRAARDGGVFLNNPLDSGIFAFCDDAIVGTIALGGSCSLNIACAGDAYCKPSGTAGCGGFCQTRLALGTSCDPNEDLCANHGTCVDPNDGGAPTCLGLGTTGDSCASPRQCQDHFVCTNNSTCQPVSTVGGPCVDVGNSSGECPSGSGCVAVTDGGVGGTCNLRGNAGDRCFRNESNGLPGCSDCFICVLPDGGYSDVQGSDGGACVALHTTQGPCTADEQCVFGEFCSGSALADGGVVVGSCQVKPRTGEGCVFPPGDTSVGQANCMYADTFCSRTDGTIPGGTCTPLAQNIGDPCGVSVPDLDFCPSQYWCAITDGGSRGVCQTLPALGSPCGNSRCMSPLYCEFQLPDAGTSTLGTCTQLPTVGSPCTQSQQCVSTAYCANDAGSLTCLAQLAAGAACTSNNQCGSGTCDKYTHQCVVPCTGPYGCGCRDGLRTTSLLLFFAAALLPFVRRRRHPARTGAARAPAR